MESIIISLMLLVWFSKYVNTAEPITVETDCGKIQGIKNISYVFKGIRYALPPVGGQRWQKPVPVSKATGTCWLGEFNATQFGNICAQKNPANEKEIIGSEDCLFLNVWTPSLSNTIGLPVMVYIHGGSLQFSSGNWPSYCPSEELARDTNIVYVSMNYRLHAFGFLALDILTNASSTGASGNYGLMDQIAALKWVQTNIRSFGGDPDQVTLFGQSSGGTSILGLLASPLVPGLFSKVWMLSASPVLNKTLADASRDNLVFLERSGCHDLQCLYRLSVADVINSVPWTVYPYWAMLDQGGLPVRGYFDGAIMIVDGYVISTPPLDAWTRGQIVNVSVMLGNTAQETDYNPLPLDINTWTWSQYESHVSKKLSTFSSDIVKTALKFYPSQVETPEFQFTSMTSDLRVTCPNYLMAKKASVYTDVPIYRYVATASPSKPFHPLGLPFLSRYAFHMYDCLAFFDTTKDFIVLQDIDKKFQENIRKEVLSFVRTGKPFSSTWKKFPSSVALLNTTTTVTGRYHKDQCDFWESSGFWSYAWIN